MESLKDRLQATVEQRKAEAGATYRSLLAKDTLTAADEHKLLDVLQVLGRSIDQVADDGELLARANALREQVAAGAHGLAQERAYTEAVRQAEQEHREAFAVANATLERQRQEISQQFSGRGAAHTARTAEHELSTLRNRLADAFGSSAEWHIKVGG